MSSERNPFEAPQIDPSGSVSVGRDPQVDLRQVAIRHRSMVYALLATLGQVVICTLFVAAFELAVGPGQDAIIGLLILIPYFGLAIAQAVLVYRLASIVYSRPVGVVLFLLMFFPCIGLLGLLAASDRATRILKSHGYKIGFLGADLRQFPDVG